MRRPARSSGSSTPCRAAGEPGFETWTPNEHWPPLGGAPWNTVSYDRELELVYFSTGQPTPWSTASRGPGDSLVYELRARGRSRHRQDPLALPARRRPTSGTAPRTRACSSTCAIDGVMRKALDSDRQDRLGRRARPADGRVPARVPHRVRQHDHGLDRRRPADLRPRKLPKPEDVDSAKVFEICPHLHGARNLQAPSYSPITGYYYLGVNNSCMNAQVVTPEFGRAAA